MSGKQKITTFLWFDDDAEEAMTSTSLFENSRILGVSRYGDAGPGPKGTVMSGTFELAGQQFMTLNGGRTSSSPRPSRCSCAARTSGRWTSCGRSSPRAAARLPSAAGSRTSPG
jgi:predicted 3-demethylubiquinone-9 3-methyltransferase (glyoxalase superfamily)